MPRCSTRHGARNAAAHLCGIGAPKLVALHSTNGRRHHSVCQYLRDYEWLSSNRNGLFTQNSANLVGCITKQVDGCGARFKGSGNLDFFEFRIVCKDYNKCL